MNGKLTQTLWLLVASLTSGTALAHGDTHGQVGYLSGLLHMLVEHGHLLLPAAAVVVAVQLKRLLRA